MIHQKWTFKTLIIVIYISKFLKKILRHLLRIKYVLLLSGSVNIFAKKFLSNVLKRKIYSSWLFSAYSVFLLKVSFYWERYLTYNLDWNATALYYTAFNIEPATFKILHYQSINLNILNNSSNNNILFYTSTYKIYPKI